MSDLSTICSINTKDFEEIKNIYGLSPIKNIDIKKMIHSYSFNNIFRHNNLFYLKYKSHKNNFHMPSSKKKSYAKTINNNNNNDFNFMKNEINNNNPINKEKQIMQKEKNNIMNKINIYNESKPVNTIIINHKANKEYVLNPESKKNEQKSKNDLFMQNKNIINYMNKKAPRPSNIYFHEYDLNNNNINISNETFGKINKDIIPIVFYNHLMITKVVHNRNKYIKTSFTQRNKKKLLTLIYYSP